MSKIDWTKANRHQPDPARATIPSDYGILSDKVANRKGNLRKKTSKEAKTTPPISMKQLKKNAKKAANNLKKIERNKLKSIPTPRKSPQEIHEKLNRHMANVEVKIKTRAGKLIPRIKMES